MLFADRVIVLGTNPGRIKAEIAIDLARPRDRRDAGLRGAAGPYLRDHDRPRGRGAAAAGQRPAPPRERPTPAECTAARTRASTASPGCWRSCATRAAPLDLADLADDLSLEVDDLLPLVDAVRHARLRPAGEGRAARSRRSGAEFADADIQDVQGALRPAPRSSVCRWCAPSTRALARSVDGALEEGVLPRRPAPPLQRRGGPRPARHRHRLGPLRRAVRVRRAARGASARGGPRLTRHDRAGRPCGLSVEGGWGCGVGCARERRPLGLRSLDQHPGRRAHADRAPLALRRVLLARPPPTDRRRTPSSSESSSASIPSPSRTRSTSGQRAKLDDYDDFALVVVYGASDDDDRLVEVHCFYSKRYLVTVHRDDCPASRRPAGPLPETRGSAAGADPVAPSGHRRADRQLLPDAGGVRRGPRRDRGRSGGRGARRTQQAIFALKRRLVVIRKAVGPQRDLLARIAGGVIEPPRA